MEAQQQHAQVKTTAGEGFQDMTAQDEASSRKQSGDTGAQGPSTSTDAKDEVVREQVIATNPPAAAYSPNRPLITNKSNKLEWQEGQLLALLAPGS